MVRRFRRVLYRGKIYGLTPAEKGRSAVGDKGVPLPPIVQARKATGVPVRLRPKRVRVERFVMLEKKWRTLREPYRPVPPVAFKPVVVRAHVRGPGQTLEDRLASRRRRTQPGDKDFTEPVTGRLVRTRRGASGFREVVATQSRLSNGRFKRRRGEAE